MRTLGCAVVILVLGSSAVGDGSAPVAPDALDEALASAGLTRRDLGWEARGWWTGYPDAPYRLRHFDALLAEPLATVPYLRGMGAVVRDLLDPAKLEEKGVREQRALSRAAFALGVDRRYGAMRAYSANLTAPRTPLADALLETWKYAGRPTKFVTFGQESPYPLVEKDVREACAVLPIEIGETLGKLVLDLLDAQRWADLAWRNVPLELRTAVWKRLDLGAEEVDALDYEPAVDDVARLWDEASLWYASIKVIEALDLARVSLAAPVAGLPLTEPWEDLRIDVRTPLGRVVIQGIGGATIDLGEEGAWLVVDLGGDDHWRGAVGASRPDRSIGAVLELGGLDEYGGDGSSRTIGAGVAGVGVVLDAGGGDRYRSASLCQGSGQFGFGALIDLGGDDVYEAQYSAQGCGFFGIGLLLDLAGKDRYEVWSDGQGFGGSAGVGVLADRSGDDAYVAVPDPVVTKRPSYHTEQKVSVSNAQGCSMGRRGDGADGHSWAGGLGALLDAEGNDAYTAGNWAQGCGYWFGTGMLWDGSGNDQYEANGWASGAGAHFCIGALVDEGGDDVHSVAQTWGPAFGHDFTVAILADLGGKDRYVAGGDGLGWSVNRSVALFLDAGGDDLYELTDPKDPHKRPGTAIFDPKMLDRTGASRYWTEPTSIALFLDAAGSDTYSAGALDGTTWSDPPESDNRKARNLSVGVDRATGTIDLERPHGGKR